jgi:hypothetical protein
MAIRSRMFHTRREVAAGNPNFKKIYEPVSAFTSTGYQWFQVAESASTIHGAPRPELMARRLIPKRRLRRCEERSDEAIRFRFLALLRLRSQ